MVNSWKIFLNNSIRIWFGVLLWLKTNGHHKGGSRVKSDITCNDSIVTSLASIVSTNAPCHYLKNSIIDCNLDN
jgi:hypothetical protein